MLNISQAKRLVGVVLGNVAVIGDDQAHRAEAVVQVEVYVGRVVAVMLGDYLAIGPHGICDPQGVFDINIRLHDTSGAI